MAAQNRPHSDSDQSDSDLEERPFLSPTTIFSDDQIKLVVKSAQLTRHVNFQIEDHLFKMAIISETNSSPLVLNITRGLSIGMRRLILKLRRYYPKDQHRQMYLTFTANGIVGGLNTRNFSIWSPVQKIVDDVLAMIENYCQSERDFKINSSCFIQVKILSMRHALLKEAQGHRRRDGSLWTIHDEVGCEACLLNYDPENFSSSLKWLYPVPLGINDISGDSSLHSCFHNQCLLLCLVLGTINAEQGFRLLCKPLTFDFQCREAGKPWLLSIVQGVKLFISIQELIMRLELEDKGPYKVQEVAEKFCNEFPAQLIVFSKENPKKIIFMHPAVFQDSRYLIPMLASEDNRISPGHVDLIVNMKRFRRLYGFLCFFCMKSINSSKSYHICNVAKTCFCCRKPIGKIDSLSEEFCDSEAAWNLYKNPEMVSFALDETKKNSLTFRKRLRRELSPPVVKTCDKCNMKCKTLTCFKNHICQKGFFCNNCRSFIYTQGYSHEDTKVNHQVFCGTEKCFRCFLHEKEYLTGDHQCTMAFPKSSEQFNNIGVLHLNAEISSVLIYEKQARGEFYMRFENGSTSEETLLWLEPMTQLKEFNSSQPTGRFGLNKIYEGRDFTDKLLKISESKRPLAKIMSFLMTLLNFVILVEDHAISLILELLINADIHFEPFYQGNLLKKIFIEHLNLTFLPVSSFIRSETIEVSLDVSSTNCEELQSAKRQKIAEKDVKSNSVDSCKVIFFAVLEYLRICIDIQLMMKNVTKSSKDFLHPFTKCLTHSSFMFNILKQHCMNLKDFHLLKSDFAAKVQSSKFEVEFVTFLEFLHGKGNVESKYSRNTPAFKWAKEDAIPDAVVFKRTAYFINGCIVHGHSEKSCHLATEKAKSRMLFGLSFMDRNLNSTRKISDFKLKYRGKFEVKEVFECSWHRMQDSLAVKRFLKETKFFRPVQRLNPRDILRGGLIEAYAHKNSSFDRKLFYKDVVSLYGYVSMTNSFPFGKIKNLLGQEIDVKSITFSNNHFYYRGKKMIGFANVRVLAPSDIEVPFLLHKIKERNMLFNCYKCASTESKICSHENVSDRSFCDSYTLPEINYAKSLNYEILEWHEIFLYSEEALILKDFVKILGSEKLKASGFPRFCTSKENFCTQINEQMHLDGDLALTLQNVSYSPERRKFYKDAINTVFGKFSSKKN